MPGNEHDLRPGLPPRQARGDSTAAPIGATSRCRQARNCYRALHHGGDRSSSRSSYATAARTEAPRGDHTEPARTHGSVPLQADQSAVASADRRSPDVIRARRPVAFVPKEDSSAPVLRIPSGNSTVTSADDRQKYRPDIAGQCSPESIRQCPHALPRSGFPSPRCAATRRIRVYADAQESQDNEVGTVPRERRVGNRILDVAQSTGVAAVDARLERN